MNEGLLIVFSGPSGAGKDTVLSRLLELDPGIKLSVSATTRAPRPGEQEGREYFFVSKEAFSRMIAENNVLEHAEYCGNYYGTPCKPIAEWTAQGSHVILEIEVQGGAQVIKKRPDCISIFILPPSVAELERRLRKRGTEAEDVVVKRLSAARGEIAQAVHYDYVVINGDIDKAAEDILEIIRAEQHKTTRNMDTIEGVLDND